MSIFQKAKKFLKANWIFVWLMCVTLCIGGITAFARYNDQHNVTKRVLATEDSQGIKFSSNYLATGAANKQVKNVAQDTNAEFELYIYNYNYSNPTVWYPTHLYYEISLSVIKRSGGVLTEEEVEDLIGSDNIVLNKVSVQDGVETLTEIAVLTKNNRSENNITELLENKTTGGTTNRYRLVLPASMTGNDICVMITATPQRQYRDLSGVVLSSKFMADLQNVVLSTGWSGSFNDDEDIAVRNYDGFNYCITGNGDSSGVLKWRSDLLEPNPFLIKELFNADIGNDETIEGETRWKKIELSALSSVNNAGRYDFQFYIVSADAKEAIADMDWDTFKNTVVFQEEE